MEACIYRCRQSWRNEWWSTDGGEFHPLVAQEVLPPIYGMVCGPRDEAELEGVWRILQASYAFACSEWMEPVQAQKGDRNK